MLQKAWLCDIGKKHAGKPGMSGVWTNPLAGALRDAVPRRYGRRHVNTEALREAVPRRYRGGTTSYWKKWYFTRGGAATPFGLLKL